jgi:hypothetical protein
LIKWSLLWDVGLQPLLFGVANSELSPLQISSKSHQIGDDCEMDRHVLQN